MIENDTNRDKFMSSEEALSYGLIDEVLKQKKQYLYMSDNINNKINCSFCGVNQNQIGGVLMVLYAREY